MAGQGAFKSSIREMILDLLAPFCTLDVQTEALGAWQWQPSSLC